MCYVRNKWYDISCATLYNVTVVHQYSRSLFSEDCTPPPSKPLPDTLYSSLFTLLTIRRSEHVYLQEEY